MSQIGKKALEIEKGVQIAVSPNSVEVSGQKGKLSRPINPEVTIKVDGNNLYVVIPGNDSRRKALQGLYRALIKNMIIGVTKGYEKRLELSGVGYRAELQGKKLVLSLGFSHPVEFEPPAGITFTVEGQTKVLISGIDKELVGQVAADIRAERPVEPYKGKGIKYAGEIVRRKAGKTAKAGA